MSAEIFSFPSRAEVYWDLLANLAPVESAKILLGGLISCPFTLEDGIPDYPGGVVFQIFSSQDPLKRVLMLEAWGSEERTTYIKLRIDPMEIVPELRSVILQLKGDMVELETGIDYPLAHDRGEVLDKMLDYLYFVAREQQVAA